jgi:SSS family solute:Na+ symporter
MRGHYITTEEINALTAAGQSVPAGLKEIASTSQVFPVFIVNHMPALFGGIVLGTLFITVVGGGAGLSFGVATILVNDIFKKVSSRIDTAVKTLITTRITIVVVLTLAMLVAIVVPGAIINDFGFLSMGLRGTVVFLPVTGALFLKGKIHSNWVVVSIVLGPIAVLIVEFAKLPFDSLIAGIAVSLICMIIGGVVKSRQQ